MTSDRLPPAGSDGPLSTPLHSAVARSHALLREANEQLVLAMLDAQQLRISDEAHQRRQTDMLAVIAHELRSPLTPIHTAAALIGRVEPDELPRVQAMIERQVALLERLIGDLLDVSRVHTGKLRIEVAPIDLGDVLDMAVEACRPDIELRRQTFDLQRPSCALPVLGDAVRLAQVVSNLLHNASKYTPAGGVLGLSVDVLDERVVLAVSDSGIGIRAGALASIFEPFVQEAAAIDYHGAGLGIGLSVVRELVEAHGGTVAASSAGPGLGSRFVVSLPLGQPAPH